MGEAGSTAWEQGSNGGVSESTAALGTRDEEDETMGIHERIHDTETEPDKHRKKKCHLGKSFSFSGCNSPNRM